MKAVTVALLATLCVAAVLSLPAGSTSDLTNPSSLIDTILDDFEKGERNQSLNFEERKKQTLAKLEALKVQLEAKAKEIVVPAAPGREQDAAKKYLAHIAQSLKEIEMLKAELLSMK